MFVAEETSWKNRIAASRSGQVADLVDDDEAVSTQPDQFGRESTAGVGLAQAGDPVGGGREQDTVALPGSGDAESGGKPRSGWIGLFGVGAAV